MWHPSCCDSAPGSALRSEAQMRTAASLLPFLPVLPLLAIGCSKGSLDTRAADQAAAY